MITFTCLVVTMHASPALSAPATEAMPLESIEQGELEDGLAVDAASYANEFGLSQAESERRLSLQANYGEAIVQVAEAATEVYGGSWIEHAGDFSLHVRLTGSEVPVTVTDIFDQHGVEPAIHTGAERALAEAEELITSLSTSVDEHHAIQGVWYDSRREEFVLDMVGISDQGGSETDKKQELRSTLPSDLPTEIATARINLVPEPMAEARRGGLDLSVNCTSGFSVRHSNGERGFITAAHCNNTQYYRNFNESFFRQSLYRSQRYAHDADVQWNRVTVQTVQPYFHASSESSYRLLQSRLVRTGQDGHSACKRGMTTGYSCGVVTSITYRPTWSGACGGNPCSAVWVRVEGSSLKCNLGDSGGSIFFNNTAYGITSGISWSSSRGCLANIHMAINYIGYLGITLYYA